MRESHAAKGTFVYMRKARVCVYTYTRTRAHADIGNITSLWQKSDENVANKFYMYKIRVRSAIGYVYMYTCARLLVQRSHTLKTTQ